jgi:hypothetical protein
MNQIKENEVKVDFSDVTGKRRDLFTSIRAGQEALYIQRVCARGSKSSYGHASLLRHQVSVVNAGENSIIEKKEKKETNRWASFLCHLSRRKMDIAEDDDARAEKMDKMAASSFQKRVKNPVIFKNLKSHRVFNGAEVTNMSRLQRLVHEMKSCCFNLGDEHVSLTLLEKWACLVYESMSATSRTFHGVQHVFDVSVDKDDIQKLCAYFHDCIYYTIDGGLSRGQKEMLGDIIVEKGGDVYLAESPFGEVVEMVSDLFGFVKGEKLNPFKGLNEYLSAALAARCYIESSLSLRTLAEIIVCIEATIPFRGDDPAVELHNRLKAVNIRYELDMDESEMIGSIQRAVDFANTDVLNFSMKDKAVFLSNTWNLLPESNISMRHTGVFKISDYQIALNKMAGFFAMLDAETIFNRFHGVPSQEIHHKLTKSATENIDIALKYMYCKKLAIGVLSAFAELSGGDAPIAMFLGDLPDAIQISPSIEDYIKVSKKQKGVILDDRVLSLLCHGREKESSFDIKSSPLAGYLYSEMGEDGVQAALMHVEFPMDTALSKKLLMSLPKRCVSKIGIACSTFAVTRSRPLKHIVNSIQDGSWDDE